jgi:Ran GTPase-activating protein (RanGAP) involved in mRNA processing and transport
MTQEERDEKNKKLREKYHQKKAEKIQSVVNNTIKRKQVNLILFLGIQYCHF